MKWKIPAIVVILSVAALAETESAGFKSAFILNQQPDNVYSPDEKLQINKIPQISTIIPIWIRQLPYNKIAGNYYLSPLNIRKSIIRPDELKSIWDFLYNNINTQYFDSAIITQIGVFEYKMANDPIPRRDIFLRYSNADTIFVLSGWFDKFISFYRTVPGFHKYKLQELNSVINSLSSLNIKIPKKVFNDCSKDSTYFIEYVDRDRMLRVRCYHIAEQRNGQDNSSIMDPYTLIEITRFLDKEMVP
jgi:hypothetical protein